MARNIQNSKILIKTETALQFFARKVTIPRENTFGNLFAKNKKSKFNLKISLNTFGAKNSEFKNSRGNSLAKVCLKLFHLKIYVKIRLFFLFQIFSAKIHNLLVLLVVLIRLILSIDWSVLISDGAKLTVESRWFWNQS